MKRVSNIFRGMLPDASMLEKSERSEPCVKGLSFAFGGDGQSAVGLPLDSEPYPDPQTSYDIGFNLSLNELYVLSGYYLLTSF